MSLQTPTLRVQKPFAPRTPPHPETALPPYQGLDESEDELSLDGVVPCSSPFVTQPTQIIANRQLSPIAIDSSSPATIVEVPRSSPFIGQKSSLGSRIAPAGTFFRRPLALSPKSNMPAARNREVSPRGSSKQKSLLSLLPQKRPSPTSVIDILDDDDDEDFLDRADIQPTTFSKRTTPSPLKASMGSPNERNGSVKRIDFASFVYSAPNPSNAHRLSSSRTPPTNDDTTSKYMKKPSARDQKATSTAPPRRRLIQGLRRQSSPVPSLPPTPAKAQPVVITDDDEDEDGYVVADDEDVYESPEDENLVKLMNEVDLKDLAALTGDKESDLKVLISHRPYINIADIEAVTITPDGRGRKKRQKIDIGQLVLEKVRLFTESIKAVDEIVLRSERRASVIKKLIDDWGVDWRGIRRTTPSPSLDGSRSASPNGHLIPYEATQPSHMSKDFPMHDFQIFGVNWMRALYRKGYGGILADDMGLGKTCQIIGFISRLLEDYDAGRLDERPFPVLVVVPPSTLDNWEAEFTKFAPELGVLRYSGSQAQRAEIADDFDDQRSDYHCVLTSYSQVGTPDDVRNLNQMGMHAAVFDEGQLLKNPSTAQYKRLYRLKVQWRLLLSGTPIQNHLMEMISLLNFVDPGLFQDRMEDIQYVFDHKIHSKNLTNAALLYGERVTRARSILEPFILQRLKDQVGQNLPPKTHTILHCDLPPDQREVYDRYEKLFKSEPSERPKASSKAGTRDNDVNNIWMQLKKAALHAQLFRRHFTDEKVEKMAKILFDRIPYQDLDLYEPKFHLLLDDLKSRSDFGLHLYCEDFKGLLKGFDIPHGSWKESGKVMKLLELIDQYKKNGDRVLVFSKFTLVIEILSYVLQQEAIDFCVLTGASQVAERQVEINRFQQNKDIPVFLLTTGAGGTGINLTAANKVIIFDMSSNPQDDKQAENRAHRLGQTRPVEIIHLIARDTVEELVYLTCQKKIELADKVVTTATSDDSDSHVKAMVRQMLVEGVGKRE